MPARLADLQQQVQAVILARQDPDSGLLPASTAITVHGDYTHAWVRDNVYSILAVWALAAALRPHDPGAAATLDEAVRRLMRGLLAAMMRQAPKVERFKRSQSALDALHAKYLTRSGEPVVGDQEWGHLQIDATALFVLMLAQMSAGGLALIDHPREQAFVQNLAYYLAKAWRTRDYGIWERGHKRNEGQAELNASSVGMAKAALEAIDGFDPLPGQAPAIFVAGDDIAHARDSLAALLPRESESKETDAALLSILGFPGHAVDDADLRERSRQRVLDRLQGRYGCKRFLRDGHQTALEDHQRLHYEAGELEQFEHIESEWPLFFTYLYIDASLAGRAEEALAWRERLDGLMQWRDGQALLPELYVVPAEQVAAERAAPGSQAREPNANLPLVWAQSLYLVGVLLQEGWLTPAQLDPLGRHRPRAPAGELLLALIAEDELVRARLAAHGLEADSLVAPLAGAATPGQASAGTVAVAGLPAVQLREPDALMEDLARLGEWHELGLTGRPRQTLGVLATSQLFTRHSTVDQDGRQGGARMSLCLPSFLCQQGGYRLLDNHLLLHEIQVEVETLRGAPRRPGGLPLLSLLITHTMLDATGAPSLLQGLVQLCQRPDVHTGALHELLPRASPVNLDHLHASLPAEVAGLPTWADQTVLDWDEASIRPLTPGRLQDIHALGDPEALRARLRRSRNPYEQLELIEALQHRAGRDADTGLDGAGPQRPGDLLRSLHQRACASRRWGLVRRCVALLNLHDDGLEDAVTELVRRGMRVALGRAYSTDAVVDRPMDRTELLARLYRHSGEDARGRVLIEEIVLLLARLARSEPQRFAGLLTLRPWQAVHLLTAWLAREHGISQAEALDHLLELSPHALLARLREVMQREQEVAADLAWVQALHTLGEGDGPIEVRFDPARDPVIDAELGGWAGWRQASGVLGRVPADFHARVWALLRHCDGLVIGDQLDLGNRLDSRLARADHTAQEHGFALLVDERISRIQAPEYRQLTVEALLALSEITRANPALHLAEALVLDVLIGQAVRLGWQQAGVRGAYADQVAQAWMSFYDLPPHHVATLVLDALRHLLAGRPRPDAAEPVTGEGQIVPADS